MLLEKFHDHLSLEKQGLFQMTLRQHPLPKQLEYAKLIANLPEGSIYIQHISWLNFTEFQLPKPIYINMVRDPVERVISWYYYVRGAYRNAIMFKKQPNKRVKKREWFVKDFKKCVLSGDPECQYIPFSVRDFTQDFKRQSMFYCGHHEDCK